MNTNIIIIFINGNFHQILDFWGTYYTNVYRTTSA